MNRAAYALVLLALFGCDSGNRIVVGSKKPLRLVIVAVDLSGSTDLQPVLRKRVKEVCLAADPNTDDLRLIKFVGTAEETFSGSVDDLRSFGRKLDEVSKIVPDQRTDYGALAQLILQTVQSSKCSEVMIFVIGDWANDFRWDAQKERQYRTTCEELAKDLRISAIRFWGVKGSSKGERIAPGGGSYAEIRDIYKPFGDRLQIRTSVQSIL